MFYNGIKTKAGIAVGSTLDEVKAAYGEPDKVRHDKYIYYSQDRSDIGFVFLKLKMAKCMKSKWAIFSNKNLSK